MKSSDSPIGEGNLTRRGILLGGTLSLVTTAGCLSAGETEQMDYESFVTAHSETSNAAIGSFTYAYEIVNLPAEDLLPGDVETAHTDFEEARDQYRTLSSEAEDQFDVHSEADSDQEDAFRLLYEYYSLMASSASAGYDALDTLLEEDDIIEAVIQSGAAFDQMENDYSDAQDIEQELNLEVDTLEETPQEIVEDWVIEHTSEIEDAYSHFETGAEEFTNEAYADAEESFLSSTELFNTLGSDINSRHAAEYPQESDLYQYYGYLGYHLGRMRSTANHLSNAAASWSDNSDGDAMGYESDAAESYSEAEEGWEQTQENLPGIADRFDPPLLPGTVSDSPATENGTGEDVEDQPDPEEVVRDIWTDLTTDHGVAINHEALAEYEYESEDYDQAENSYATTEEDWTGLEEEVIERKEDYNNDEVVNKISTLSNYFSLKAQEASEMEDAASARAGEDSLTAAHHESDAEEYRNDAESEWDVLEPIVEAD